jgi:hypothetical protein
MVKLLSVSDFIVPVIIEPSLINTASADKSDVMKIRVNRNTTTIDILISTAQKIY